jgi:hypothetical protein
MYIYEYKENREVKQRRFDSLHLALDNLFEHLDLNCEIVPITISDGKNTLIDYNDFIFRLRRIKCP